jgi:hypothetical protein
MLWKYDSPAAVAKVFFCVWATTSSREAWQRKDNKKARIKRAFCLLAERVGFEPTKGY